MNEAITVNGIFDDFLCHVTDNMKKEESFRDEDGTLILSLMNCTLDDGNMIELCLWADSDITLWDVSADKAGFDFHGFESFEEYMKSKGLHACNVVEKTDGMEWKYCGEIEMNDKYRLQYLTEI